MIPQHVAIAEDGSWFIPRMRRALPKRDAGIARIVAREQQVASPSTFKGEAILPAALLQKKLGKTTFRVYAYLLTIRNRDCETHPSVAGLSRMSGVGEAQVEKSLARLRTFGLVKDHGFTYQHVPCKCAPSIGPHMHKVYVRKVFGQLKTSDDLQTQSVLVPRETARLVKEAAGQGGARAGAGRPKGVKDSAPRKTIKGGAGKSNVGAYKYQVPISSESLSDSLQKCGVSLRVQVKSTERAGKERKNPLRHHLPILLGSLTSSPTEQAMPSLTQPMAQPEAVPALPVEQRAAPAAAHSDEEASGATGCFVDGREVGFLEMLQGTDDANELGFSGGGAGARQRFTVEDLRATTQIIDLVAHPHVPAPLKVQAEHTAIERLALLKAAYRAAHEKTFRTEFWRKGKKQSDRERALMVEASHALVAEGISPTSWARFSFWQWQRMGKTTAPSAKWVWSTARIHEHAGWCREAVGSLSSASSPLMPAGKELLKRLGDLQLKLGWGRPTADVVSEILPERERQQLVQQQAQQLEAWKQDMAQRIRNGEWVWG